VSELGETDCVFPSKSIICHYFNRSQAFSIANKPGTTNMLVVIRMNEGSDSNILVYAIEGECKLLIIGRENTVQDVIISRTGLRHVNK